MHRSSGLSLVLSAALLGGCSYSREDVLRYATSVDFADLHSKVLSWQFKNVAVLPDAAFVVVDGTVINIRKHTFGEEPPGAMYETYYEQGSKNGFRSLSALLKQQGVYLTEDQLSDITLRMKRQGIGDIAKESDGGVVTYSWNMSGIWGANGVVFVPSREALDKVRKQCDLLEPIRDGFYYWATGG